VKYSIKKLTVQLMFTAETESDSLGF